MLLSGASALMLIAGTWMACRTKDASARGDARRPVEEWTAGVLLVGGLLLVGFGMASAMHPAVLSHSTERARAAQD